MDEKRKKKKKGITLDVEEDGLFPESVMIDSTDHVLSAILQLDSVDDERVVIAVVALHELDTLLQLAVFMRPGDSGRSDGDDPAVEFGALSFVGEGRFGSDDKARSSFATVEGQFMDAEALHVQFAETAVLGETTDGHQKVVPVGIFGADAIAHRRVASGGDLRRQLTVIALEPGVLQTFVGRHPLVLALGQQAADEVLGVLRDAAEGLRVKVPVAGFDVLERFDVVLTGEGREAAEQDVGQHSDGPHVRVEAHRLAFHDLGRREFGRSRRDLDQFVGIEFGGQTEVDELDGRRVSRLAHDVLRLDVQVDDVLLVHVFDGFADLAHVVDDLRFRHDVAVGRDALEQFAARKEFEDEHHFVVVFERVVQVDQLGVVQMVHDVDLFADELLLHRLRHRNELGRKDLHISSPKKFSF